MAFSSHRARSQIVAWNVHGHRPQLVRPAARVNIDHLSGCVGNKDDRRYIDPSGKVLDQGGNPIAGATVTLYCSGSVFDVIAGQ
jgi:hypothetical protein